MRMNGYPWFSLLIHLRPLLKQPSRSHPCEVGEGGGKIQEQGQHDSISEWTPSRGEGKHSSEVQIVQTDTLDTCKKNLSILESRINNNLE